MSWTRSCLPAVGLALATVAGAQTAEGFEEELASIRRRIDSGKWSRARKELAELLDEHGPAAYVVVRGAALCEDYQRCLFYESYEPPELEDLISGELVSYKERNGEVHLRYTPETLADFTEVDERILVHPLTFEGAYSVELEFDPYPAREVPFVVVGFDTDTPVQAVWGCKKAGRGNVLSWAPAKILMRKEAGAPYELVAEDDNPPAEVGEREKVKVTVKSGAVALYVGGRKILSGKRRKGIYGQIALVDCGGSASIEVRGRTQPSWFQGLLDEAANRAWDEFEESFQAADHLPGWLVEPSGSSEATLPRVTCPGEARTAQDEAFPQILSALEAGDVDRARAVFLALGRGKTTEVFRAFVESLVLASEGEHERALTLARRAGELAPGHAGTRRLEAQLLSALGRTGDALPLLEQLRRETPADGGLVAEVARAYIRLGELDRAREVVAESLVGGVSPAELEGVQSVLTKARRGPQWGERYEVRTKHYEVVSDIDQATCYEAANHLEKSLQRFNRDLRRFTGKAESRYVVYLFSGHEGYQAYVEDVAGSRIENTAGLYSSSIRQLLVWNLPDRDTMFRTIRHEGFHQYFDRLVDDAPRWLNEGLAEYYELIELVGGRWNQGLPSETHLRTLQVRSSLEQVPLDEFFRWSDRRFFQDAALSYAMGWAAVHFLRHGGSEPETCFDVLIDALVEGRSASEATDLAFGDLDAAAFDRAFRAHVAGL